MRNLDEDYVTSRKHFIIVAAWKNVSCRDD